MQNVKENWLVLSKMTWRMWRIFVYRLKNSKFIISKMAKLNQNKNSKQRYPPDAVWKLDITWKTWKFWTNKTFYTCFTESLFWRCKKMSKKAVNLGSLLQCSVHIFLGHDGSVWKINLRILWNHIIKNFQLKHGQCDSSHIPKNVF